MCVFTLYRDLPRALLIGIPLVTIVYLLTNIAYIAVIGGEGILTSGAVAMVSQLGLFIYKPSIALILVCPALFPEQQVPYKFAFDITHEACRGNSPGTVAD